MNKRSLTAMERHFLDLPVSNVKTVLTESILNDQDRLDWLQFIDTLNDYAFSSDMIKEKGD